MWRSQLHICNACECVSYRITHEIRPDNVTIVKKYCLYVQMYLCIVLGRAI
jgi:hypothetical protein